MNAEIETFKIFVRNFVNIKEKVQSEFVDVAFSHEGVECNIKNKYLKLGSKTDAGLFTLQRTSLNIVEVYKTVCDERVHICNVLIADINLIVGNFVELDEKVYYIKRFDDSDNITISEQNNHEFPDVIIKTDEFFEKCKPFCKSEISYCKSIRIEEGFYTIEKKIKVPKSNEPLIVIDDKDYNIFLNQRDNVLTVKTTALPAAILHTSVLCKNNYELFLYKTGVKVYVLSEQQEGVVEMEEGYSPKMSVRLKDGRQVKIFKTQVLNDLVVL